MPYGNLVIVPQGAAGKDGDVGAPGAPGPAVSAILLRNFITLCYIHLCDTYLIVA